MGWRGGWRGWGWSPWPGRGPFSYLPPWMRPGWLFGRGSCWWLFGSPWGLRWWLPWSYPWLSYWWLYPSAAYAYNPWAAYTYYGPYYGYGAPYYW